MRNFIYGVVALVIAGGVAYAASQHVHGGCVDVFGKSHCIVH